MRIALHSALAIIGMVLAVAAPAARAQNTPEAVKSACNPGVDPKEPGSDYPGGISQSYGGLTPVSLPGAPTVDRRQVDVIVPPEAPSGSYQFYIRGQDGRPGAFGNVTVRQKQSEFLTREDVTIANPVDAQFAGDIRLDGYDLPVTQVRPGETVQLTLYWSSGGDIRQRYKVFTHLLGDVFNAANGNFLWGQADNEPAGNTRPTTSWRNGETIVDEYAIPVAAGTPPGEYRLEIGLYDPATGARLPLLDGNGSPSADHLILATVEVVP